MINTTAHLVHKYDSPSLWVSYLIFQVEDLLEFDEGQFVMIETEIQWKTMKNPYSIATTNKEMLDEKHIGIVVKKTSDHGMSHWMTHDISLWDSVKVKWPVGHYTNNNVQQNYLFVSIWSGLSPNFGLFKHLVYENQSYWTIVNIFAERFAEHIIPHVHEIFTEHWQKNIHNFFYLSQEKNIPQWFRKWYVQEWLEEAVELLWTNTSCFLCGKPEMVDDVRSKLEYLWVAKQDITFEKY